jgi:hypothetical protein
LGSQKFGDIKEIIKITSINSNIFVLIGFSLLILLGYTFYKEFPNLLKNINPKITKKGIKKSFIIFSIFVLLLLLIFTLFQPDWKSLMVK